MAIFALTAREQVGTQPRGCSRASIFEIWKTTNLARAMGEHKLHRM
jgi:hypothetical protein